jgi:hypothetical protein
VQDAVNNTYVNGMTDLEWLAATLQRLGGTQWHDMGLFSERRCTDRLGNPDTKGKAMKLGEHARLIVQARTEERERCAKIAEEMRHAHENYDAWHMALAIASLIRKSD